PDPYSLIPDPCSLVGQHRPQLRLVGGCHERRPLKPALAAAGLAREDVALERAAPLELSGARLLEPLGGPSMRLQFRHDCPSVVRLPALGSRLPARNNPLLSPEIGGLWQLPVTKAENLGQKPEAQSRQPDMGYSAPAGRSSRGLGAEIGRAH